MKVLCTNHDHFGRNTIPYGPNDPQIGDECTVLNKCIGYGKDGDECPCYELEGYNRYVYDQRNFSTLTDLDETELVNEEFNEKYCVPVNS